LKRIARLQNPAKLEALVQVLQGMQNQTNASKSTTQNDKEVERSKVIDISNGIFISKSNFAIVKYPKD
jgi:hypothetical protein